ncbi:MAG: transposase [Nitrospira sp.]|nr:transposase [Nitrospira sp.]
MPTPCRQYTDEFKQEAVRLVREAGRPIAQVARDLEIAERRFYRRRVAQQAAESHGPQSVTRAELARLQRENQRLRQERDFLRRAATFFAREST